MRKTLVALLLLGLAACAPSDDDIRVHVLAAFYPVAYAAENLGGQSVRVTNLTPAGVEPHDYELTSDDIDAIEDADFVFYVGGGFQPALEKAIERREGPSVDVAEGLVDIEGDPHFWLDPAALLDAAFAMAEQLDRPIGSLRERLIALDRGFAEGLAACERRDIVTAHASFAYLAQRYGLTQHGIAGVSPEAEPSPAALADLSDLIAREGVSTVFYEELVPRDFAETLAKDAGVKTAVLNPLEALTEKQEANDEDYFSIMRANLAALRTALDCE